MGATVRPPASGRMRGVARRGGRPPEPYTPGAMRGILSAGGYIPHGRLDRSAIAPFVGTGGGKGSRSVASYDEDTTTMGFEAARLALRAATDSPRADMVWFSTVTPAYLDKT